MRKLILCAAMAAPSFVTAAEKVDPSPATDVPRYQSTFQDYKRFSDQAVRPWREVIEEIGKLGGWRSYAKESAEARQADEDQTKPGSGQ